MKESVGTAWIYMIAVTLIILFSGYLAFSINRSRAFKVKNEIINIIERHNGNTDDARGSINDYLVEVGYRTTGTCEGGATGYTTAAGGDPMYCIEKIVGVATGEGIETAKYRVTTFFGIDVPIISLLDFKVSGDSKSIYIPLGD